MHAIVLSCCTDDVSHEFGRRAIIETLAVESVPGPEVEREAYERPESFATRTSRPKARAQRRRQPALLGVHRSLQERVERRQCAPIA